MIKKRPKTPREAAAFSLFNMAEDGAWSQESLNYFIESANLSSRDAALATRLVYGVLQNRALCDFYISKYSKIRLKKISQRVLEVLRLGVYQLLFMDKIPESAAVNESVELIKNYAHASNQTVGFANGVLRAIARSIDALPQLNCPTKEDYYSLKYSHPKWLVELFVSEYGLKDTEALLKANNEISPVVLRINTIKASCEDILSKLQSAGINACRHPKIENCILSFNAGKLEALEIFTNGSVTVQDGASQTCVSVLNPKPDAFVIDCCAAPGGKSFFIAEKMQNTGKLISCDIFEAKLLKIQQGAERLGLLNIATSLQDASVFNSEFSDKADYVLCDVPCSGLGIIRKKPEIRYKDNDEISALPILQAKIINNCAKYVKKGGVLVYSTCTILKRENQDVVIAFLKENPDFEIEPFENPLCGEVPSGMITLLPHIHETDGFFIAKLRRKR